MTPNPPALPVRRYATIVADPPWPMPDSGKRNGNGSRWWESHTGKNTPIPYETMSLQEIQNLQIPQLAAKDCHLYLWTTNRFLEDAYQVARSWSFKPTQLLTWCKPPMGKGHGGAFVSTTEFCLFCRRGSLPALQRIDSTWFKWSRVYENGHIKHSAKPEEFYDLVTSVSPSPRVELFARRNRLGWSAWGNECLSDVEVTA